MRKTSIAKMYETKRVIVARVSAENMDWGFKKLSENKINHEFVDKQENDRKTPKTCNKIIRIQI